MGGAVVDRLLRTVEFQEPEGQTAGKAVAATDAVENLELGILTAVIKFPVVPADGAPVVSRRRDHAAKRRGRHLEVGIFLHGLLDHLPEGIGLDRADRMIDPLHLKPKAGGEVFLVADHHVDIVGDLAVDLAGLRLAADALPEARPVVEVVGNDRAMLLGCLDGFDRDRSGRLRERGEDPAGVKPPDTDRTEDMPPVDVARLELAGRRVAPVGHAHRPTDAEAPLREIEAVANGAADAVVGSPLDEVGGHAPLHDEVFDEVADLIVNEGCDDRGLQAKALPQAAGHVVFAAPFPGIEVTGRADATLARVEAEHDLAE